MTRLFLNWMAGVMLLANSLCAAPNEHWIASGGFGLAIGSLGDTQVLLTPQLEFVRSPRLFLGPLIQVGIASSTIFGISGSVRYLVGNHAQVRPCFEGGLGMAFATSAFLTSSVGILIHLGMGVDYQVDPNFSVGTLFRANIAPPLDSFFLSWPLVIARFAL